jgi:hypothetical protein
LGKDATVSLRLPTAVSLWLCSSLTACKGEPAVEAGTLVWLDTIYVEENSSVVNVTPRIAPDPLSGGFLVADQRESQVRVYGRSGRLISYLGRLGQGPGEFEMVTSLRRLNDGSLIAAEWNGRLTKFSAAGDSTVTISTGLIRLEDMEVLDDSLIALTGFDRSLPTDQIDSRIHIFDLRRGRFVARFFRPEPLFQKSQIAITAGWTKIALKEDTLAAVFSLVDSVYLYSADGRRIDQIGFGGDWFRHAREEPSSGVTRDPKRRAEWLSTLDFVGDVQFLPNGDFGVVVQRVEPGTALNYTYELLRIDRNGRNVVRVADVPRVLLLMPNTDTIVTMDPDLEVPNRWLVGRWP